MYDIAASFQYLAGLYQNRDNLLPFPPFFPFITKHCYCDWIYILILAKMLLSALSEELSFSVQTIMIFSVTDTWNWAQKLILTVWARGKIYSLTHFWSYTMTMCEYWYLKQWRTVFKRVIYTSVMENSCPVSSARKNINWEWLSQSQWVKF